MMTRAEYFESVGIKSGDNAYRIRKANEHYDSFVNPSGVGKSQYNAPVMSKEVDFLGSSDQFSIDALDNGLAGRSTAIVPDATELNNSTAAGLGSLLPGSDSSGMKYTAPANQSASQLEAQYSPEQLGSMDFSGYEAGSLGTTATKSPGMTGAEMWGVGLGVAGTSLNAIGAYQDYKFAKADLKDKKERTNLLRERRDETAKFKSNTASAFR